MHLNIYVYIDKIKTEILLNCNNEKIKIDFVENM